MVCSSLWMRIQGIWISSCTATFFEMDWRCATDQTCSGSFLWHLLQLKLRCNLASSKTPPVLRLSNSAQLLDMQGLIHKGDSPLSNSCCTKAMPTLLHPVRDCVLLTLSYISAGVFFSESFRPDPLDVECHPGVSFWNVCSRNETPVNCMKQLELYQVCDSMLACLRIRCVKYEGVTHSVPESPRHFVALPSDLTSMRFTIC